MSMTAKKAKSNSSKCKVPVFTEDDYARVLQEHGPNVECAAEIGQGALVMIKPALKDGRKVILTRTLYFEVPTDKEFLRGISKSINSDDNWETWDIFG